MGVVLPPSLMVCVAPAPARSVISFAGASTPEVAKTVFAASINASTLRRASARRRGAGSPLPGFAEPGDETPACVLF